MIEKKSTSSHDPLDTVLTTSNCCSGHLTVNSDRDLWNTNWHLTWFSDQVISPYLLTPYFCQLLCKGLLTRP